MSAASTFHSVTLSLTGAIRTPSNLVHHQEILRPQILTGSFVLITTERIKITDAVAAIYLEKNSEERHLLLILYFTD
jgi:hypothetical protein